ncbi:hypothetical protein [Aquidulcibacter sp.]|uniref:hypothetical protein n=1 Tax=Aquidulcibacter sp. TaxID=2052990 RepID=UPI0025C0D731|nr:hypothetical protein [Aquidulcibacter sp.]MCA3694439.1 hypothetical protein [Aquidulcibacter sp.]
MAATFETSVCINCAFDQEFSPLLHAIAFCVVDLGFYPRLAPETADHSTPRLERITTLINSSKFGIHDLSKCKTSDPEAYFRMNMPFELGMDFGARRFGDGPLKTKAILVLEHTAYDTKKALSDIAGWDVLAHDGNYDTTIRQVRNWMVHAARATPKGPARIIADYASFQQWYYERELQRGSSEEDIRSYPTIEFISAMEEWVALGRPA